MVVRVLWPVDDTPEANRDRLVGSLTAGAHFLSTDFPAPAEPYWADIPGGVPARCNPVSAPGGCVATDLEALP